MKMDSSRYEERGLDTMEKIIERKRRRLEMRPVFTREEPELEAMPRTIVD
jgi:hypothetical protein